MGVNVFQNTCALRIFILESRREFWKILHQNIMELHGFTSLKNTNTQNFSTTTQRQQQADAKRLRCHEICGGLASIEGRVLVGPCDLRHLRQDGRRGHQASGALQRRDLVEFGLQDVDGGLEATCFTLWNTWERHFVQS